MDVKFGNDKEVILVYAIQPVCAVVIDVVLLIYYKLLAL